MGAEMKATSGHQKNSVPLNTSFVALMGFLQVAMLVLYGTCTKYAKPQPGENVLDSVYPFFQDVHVMMFIGFGFLMTFLKKYSLSATGFNFLVAAFCIQWSILLYGFWKRAFDKSKDGWSAITLDIPEFVAGDFSAATALITFGALLGKIGPGELLLVAFLEMIFYTLNETIGIYVYEAVDRGGSMYVHTFGAFFGLACSFAFKRSSEREARTPQGMDGSSAVSDTFAMIGTIFLWMYWPSFNGALATGTPRLHVVMNTVLALTSSCMAAFYASYLLRRTGKFNMVDIQNATLAGGVAVGSCSDLLTEAWPAMLIGMIAGTVSVAGYVYITPALDRIGLHDTCGVLNLHGIPGVMGGVASAIKAASADKDDYDTAIFPHSSLSVQGGYQAATLFTTLGIAIASGLLVGFVARAASPMLDTNPEHEDLFDDSKYWDEEGEEHEQPQVMDTEPVHEP